MPESTYMRKKRLHEETKAENERLHEEVEQLKRQQQAKEEGAGLAAIREQEAVWRAYGELCDQINILERREEDRQKRCVRATPNCAFAFPRGRGGRKGIPGREGKFKRAEGQSGLVCRPRA